MATICCGPGSGRPSPAPAAGSGRLPILKRDDPEERTWTAMHRMADGVLPTVRRKFLEAVQKALTSVRKSEVLKALEAHDLGGVLRALEPGVAAVAGALDGAGFRDALDDLYRAGGRHGMAEAGGARGAGLYELGIRFDITDPRALAHLRSELAGRLIREVSETTRKALTDIVLDGFKNGVPVGRQAQKILQVETFGLTQRQLKAVSNLESALTLSGMVGEKLTSSVARYRAKMLRMRAETIARTETIGAAEAGRTEGWRQAAEKGLFTESEARQFWVVTPDDRLCDYCQDVKRMNKEGVPLGGAFKTPDGGLVTRPTAHPRCRCTRRIRFGR